jgi:hypothetical protein
MSAKQQGNSPAPNAPSAMEAKAKAAGSYAAGRLVVSPDGKGLKQPADSGDMTGAPKQGNGTGPDWQEGRGRGRPGHPLMSTGNSKVGGGAKAAIEDAVGKRGPITGGRYGDTFAGGRVNHHFSGAKSDFSGGGAGLASENDGSGSPADGERSIIGVGAGTDSTGMNREDSANMFAAMLGAEGGTSSGSSEKDAAELAYAQAVGPDGYAATKNMSDSDRKAYWEQEAKKQKAGYERDDSMGGGGPMLNSEAKTNGNGIGARKSAAGGSNDGRTETQAKGNSGGMITRNRAGGPEREVAGAVNMNAVLKINQQVNPGRH